MIQVNFKLLNNCKYPPQKATVGASGFDICANIEQEIKVTVNSYVKIPTGIAIELPPNYEAQIRPRSGLAAKYGLTLVNTPGTVDSDYRGEINVLIINLGQNDYVIQPGERIAQMVIQQIPEIQFVQVDEFCSKTARDDGGFGSSGKKENLYCNQV